MEKSGDGRRRRSDLEELEEMEEEGELRKELEEVWESTKETLQPEGERPETHPLAEAEEALDNARWYCTQCSREGQYGKSLKYHENAIKEANRARKNVRNVELKTKGMSDEAKGLAIYNILKKGIKPIANKIEKYRNPEEFEGFLTEFSQIAGIDITEDRSLLKGIVEEGDPEAVFKYASVKILPEIMGFYQDVDREKTIDWLDEKSQEIKERDSLYKAIDDLDRFYLNCNHCAPPCGYNGKRNLKEAKEKVAGAIEERVQPEKDLRNTVSYLIDVSANLLRNMDDEDYEELKSEVLDYAMNEASGMGMMDSIPIEL